MLQWEESRLCFIFFRWRRVILRVFLYICTSFPAWGGLSENSSDTIILSSPSAVEGSQDTFL